MVDGGSMVNGSMGLVTACSTPLRYGAACCFDVVLFEMAKQTPEELVKNVQKNKRRVHTSTRTNVQRVTVFTCIILSAVFIRVSKSMAIVAQINPGYVVNAHA